jgi:hypothetical protein
MCQKFTCNDCPTTDLGLCGIYSFEQLSEVQLDDYIEAFQRHEKHEPDKETEEIFADFDVVERPAHYTKTSIECIDAMRETQGDDAVKAFCVCNAFKYLWRHNRKNGDEDIKKASWYLNKAVEIMEGEKKC